jgi:hypothetical protein
LSRIEETIERMDSEHEKKLIAMGLKSKEEIKKERVEDQKN